MARYRDAIDWIVENDDTEDIEKHQGVSVSAALVADLFGKTDEQVCDDIRKKLEKRKAS